MGWVGGMGVEVEERVGRKIERMKTRKIGVEERPS